MNRRTEIAQKRGGFTLVELLVVIAIIALIGGTLASSFGGGGSQDPDTASRTLSSVIQQARTTAINRGEKTFVLIHNDTSEPNRYRREIGVIYEDPDNDDKFIAANQGTRLPEGILVLTGDKDSGKPFDSSVVNWPSSTDINGSDYQTNAKLSNAQDNIQINFPSNKPQPITSGTKWLAYEIRANGTAAPGTANNKLAVLKANKTGPSAYRIDNPYNSSIVIITRFAGTLIGEYEDTQ